MQNKHYLTLIDCGLSRYAIWRRLHRQDSISVTTQLNSIFLERGAREKLLTDNAASFRGSTFREFTKHWGMMLRYRCANVPSGNAISERCHRTVKTIRARKSCSDEGGSISLQHHASRKHLNIRPRQLALPLRGSGAGYR